MSGRALVAALACALAFSTAFRAQQLARGPAPFELDEATIAELQGWMSSGRYTARRLVELYAQRIAQLDRNGPALRSIIEMNPAALAIADSLDRDRKAKGPRGPLHGIPLVIKDNIDTADAMMTTAGSLALEGSMPSQDAFLVDRLRRAGAVILGKTNLSEWANFRSTKSTSGWSARGGQVKNPYVLDRNPCGSSSGTGVAIAANLAAVGIGTETDGSILCPAALNNLVGIKPTVGLVSRSGIVPISHTQDTAGPMTRTVADAAAVLAAIAGADPRDSATTITTRPPSVDYTQSLDPRALTGARIGIVRAHYFGYSAATDRLIDIAIAAMRSRGAVIVDPANVPTVAELDACEEQVLLYEFKADVNAYLKTRGPKARVHSLTELIAFNTRERTREMPYFGQERFLAADRKGPLTEAAYRNAAASCRALSRTRGIDAVLTMHRLDALVAPTTGPAWLTNFTTGDRFDGASTTAAAVAGYPSITVPAGFVGALPVGMSFFGTAWSEPKLVALAYAYEQANKHRRPPQFLATSPR